MEIKDIQRKKKTYKRISISIRISKVQSDFMKKHNISPTKILIKVLEELMNKK